MLRIKHWKGLMKKQKWQTQKSSECLEKRKIMYLGILEVDSIWTAEYACDKFSYFSTRKPVKIELCRRQLIKRINAWALSVRSYSGQFVKWAMQELRKIVQRTGKLNSMHKVLHPRDYIEWVKKRWRKRIHRHWWFQRKNNTRTHVRKIDYRIQ